MNKSVIKVRKLKKGGLVCVDLYKNIILEYTDNLIPKEKKRLNKSDLSVCYIEARAFTTLFYNSDKTNNLQNKITAYAYKELLLDPSKEYKISYYKSGDNSYIIYVIDIDIVLKNLNIKKQKILKNIDIALPSPILMSGFYSGGLLDKFGVDCFIFFDENESYMSFYKDGEYIFYHAIIGDNLSFIAKENNLEYNLEIFGQNIGKFSSLINATIQTLKSIENIDKITPNRIFLSSFLGDLKEFNLNLKQAINKDIKGFEFLAKFNSSTPINLMLAIYTKELINSQNMAKFRLFDRPKPLYKRAEGRLIISLAAGAILGLIYPIYMLILALSLDMNAKDFGLNLSLQNSSATSLNSSLALINNELKKISNKKQNIEDNINLNLSKIDNIAAKIDNQNRAKILADIAKSMQTHSIQARKIELNSSQIQIALVSENTQNINNFIEIFKNNAQVGKIINNQNLFESNITIGLGYGI